MAGKTCHYCWSPLPGDAGFCGQCGGETQAPLEGLLGQEERIDQTTGEPVSTPPGRRGFFASLTTGGRIGLVVVAAALVALAVVVVVAVV